MNIAKEELKSDVCRTLLGAHIINAGQLAPTWVTCSRFVLLPILLRPGRRKPLAQPHTHTRDMGAQIPPLPPSPLLLESVVQETPFGHTTLLLLQRRRERVMWCPFWRATANPDARPQRASAPPPPAGRGYICTCPRSHFLCFVFLIKFCYLRRERKRKQHTRKTTKKINNNIGIHSVIDPFPLARPSIATKMLDICDGNINTREGIDLIDFSHFIFRARPLGNRLDKEICPI